MGQLSCCTHDDRVLGLNLDIKKEFVNANTGKKSKEELQELMLPEDFKVPTEIMTELEKATGLVIIDIINIE